MRSSFIVHFIYRNYEFVVWGKIMKKVIFILIFISTITGCYSAKDDCYYGMTTICFGKPYSPIAKFQKPYSFGHTECMEIKGYIWVEDCGRKNSTSDKGLCNE